MFVQRLVVIILELSHPIMWLVKQVCSDKAEFSFFCKAKPIFYINGISEQVIVTSEA